MKNPLTPYEIMQQLESRQEEFMRFTPEGLIISRHGKATINTWIEKDRELICIDCKTIYEHSI